MARIDDCEKLTPEEEEEALKKLYEQGKDKHGDRFLTLTKDEATAKYILRERLKERGETPANSTEIEARARRGEIPGDPGRKYGSADWTPPDLTKPLPREPSPELWDALGQFVNLPDDGLNTFREQYPGFFPPWFYSLPCGNDAEPNAKTGLLAWQAWRALLREAWHASFHPEYVAQLVNIPTTPPGNKWFEIQPVWDAQRAVLAIALETWRARFCPKCGRPFVARRAADKYWPKECFAEQRREKQKASKRKRARLARKSKKHRR